MTWAKQNPLRRWRAKQGAEGWNQSQAARELGVTPQTVSYWESGLRIPGLENLVAIEELTGIRPRQWLGWLGRRPKDG